MQAFVCIIESTLMGKCIYAKTVFNDYSLYAMRLEDQVSVVK